LIALDEALAAGFSDEAQLTSLLEAPNLVNPVAVKEKIDSRPGAVKVEATETGETDTTGTDNSPPL
jgi:hypothetical protein